MQVVKGSDQLVPDIAPIPCEMGWGLISGKTVIGTGYATSISWVGLIGADRIVIFRAGTISIPCFGRYTLTMTNANSAAVLKTSKLSLERDANTENQYFLSGLCYITTFIFLGISVVLLIYVAVKSMIFALFKLGKLS